jgi:predicted O-methyltransferase YrrM
VALTWAATSRETTNYNYPLSELNYRHLAWFVSAAAGVPVRRARELFDEALHDAALRQHIERATLASPFARVSEPAPHFGRRLAWYALVRLRKPSLVVETGTERGLGSCLLAAALLRNGSGELVTVDPSPTAGWLISGDYAGITTMVRGSADDALRDLGRPLDILVHDVHATREQEEAEYQAAMPWLSDGALIVNDNAHGFDVLPTLCEARGWRYLHFREVPVEHWYPGAGLGVAVVTATGTDM